MTDTPPRPSPFDHDQPDTLPALVADARSTVAALERAVASLDATAGDLAGRIAIIRTAGPADRLAAAGDAAADAARTIGPIRDMADGILRLTMTAERATRVWDAAGHAGDPAFAALQAVTAEAATAARIGASAVAAVRAHAATLAHVAAGHAAPA